jgi:hypothetical protein
MRQAASCPSLKSCWTSHRLAVMNVVEMASDVSSGSGLIIRGETLSPRRSSAPASPAPANLTFMAGQSHPPGQASLFDLLSTQK